MTRSTATIQVIQGRRWITYYGEPTCSLVFSGIVWNPVRLRLKTRFAGLSPAGRKIAKSFKPSIL